MHKHPQKNKTITTKETQVMSKNNKTAETVVANPEGKTVEELKEVAQALQTQLAEHQKQANHHQTMAVKAQGALEIMLQLIPKQEVEEMIAKEKEVSNKDNGELVEG
jgi:anion-transporting  ArsA/GET3 family ATPase